MLIRRTPGWALPERSATDEGVYLRRREIVKAMGLGALSAIAAPGLALGFIAGQGDEAAGEAEARHHVAGAGELLVPGHGGAHHLLHQFQLEASLDADGQQQERREDGIQPLGQADVEAEQGLQQAMQVGGREQVAAAGHQGDALVVVVDRDAQVVAGGQLLARQHHVAEALRPLAAI